MMWGKSMVNQFNSFCRETTTHGFAYLSDNYTACERLLWFVFVLLAFASSIVMIEQSFQDAKSNPILTTIDTVDVTRVPFPAVTVLPDEYPIQKELGGFFKRLFDYAEFERYNIDSPLRNNSLFIQQWGFMINSIVQKLIDATKEDIKDLSESEYEKMIAKYKTSIKNYPSILSDVISEESDSRKLLSSLSNELKINFLKYKGYGDATKVYFREVVEPFVKKAIMNANLTQSEKNYLSTVECSAFLKNAQIALIIPIEILKLSDNIWQDIGAGHFLESALSMTGINLRKLKETTKKITNSLIGLNFSGSDMKIVFLGFGTSISIHGCIIFINEAASLYFNCPNRNYVNLNQTRYYRIISIKLNLVS